MSDDPNLTSGKDADENGISRKRALQLGLLAVPAAAALGAATPTPRSEAVPRDLEPTPQCDDGDDPTIPQMEGPYFKPNSPQRTSLVTPQTPGIRLLVTGYVFTRSCVPVAQALLDFWQANSQGGYDNIGYNFRGHQFTGPDGEFTLSTIVPGLYPGRTRHLHVKVQAPNRPILTTQLYFPNEPRNNTDPIFDPRLLMTVRNTPTGGREATFDFVLNFG
ncbi:dioxygenase [Amycolatopsis lurida]